MNLILALVWNVRTCVLMLREPFKWKHHKNVSTDTLHRGGLTRNSGEATERWWSEGVELSVLENSQPIWDELVNKTKPFDISKKSVMTAWKNVKANKGTYGVDEESIADFEANLKSNLYKIWNRMSSGTYFPPPVKAVEILKPDGRVRLLGVPTVGDRVAQAVVKDFLETIVEPKFHQDSYGYRPRKSALDAVGVARKRCWQYSWCIDLDIRAFFDTLDHELMMKAVKFHTKEKWIHLYVERWLKAPLQKGDGELIKRECGASQGGAASPLLANIYMHHAFDDWMKRQFPEIMFERYVDDILVHCGSKKLAENILEVIKTRLKECGLEEHPEKTKIVYCKDSNRDDSHEFESFDFLGYTFRPRLAMNKQGEGFVSFSPAISKRAANHIKKEIRSWKIQQRSSRDITGLAKMFNAQVQGWVNYYGRYHISAMYPHLRNLEKFLIRWASKKYKRLRCCKKGAKRWLGAVRSREPKLFVHWRLGLGSPVG